MSTRIISLFPSCLLAAAAAAQQPVRVILDMDAAAPGIQSSVTIAPATTTVPGLAVYIYDPTGTRTIRAIGYAGGLDRGLAIGHTPSILNVGSVTTFTGHIGTPLTAGAINYLTTGIQKGFAGPELHYLEFGQDTPLPSAPIAPIFTIDVHLSGAIAGDDFRIFLLDMVTVWRGTGGGVQAGAFWTVPGNGLDTGGDCVPDGTVTLEGIDPDPPVPVPPASFLVDYIDGQFGGRIIVAPPVGCYANCDASTGTPVLTANDFVCFINAFAAGSAFANCDGSTGTPALTGNDFVCFINAFATGCS